MKFRRAYQGCCVFLSKDFIDKTNAERKEGWRGKKIDYQLKPKIRLPIIYFCYKLDPHRILHTCMHTCIYAHNAHTHACTHTQTVHTHTHTSTLHTNPLLYWFHMFLPVYISVVVFSIIVHIAASPQNGSGSPFPINFSASPCLQTLNLQAGNFSHLLSR